MKKKAIPPFATAQADPEILMLQHVSQYRKINTTRSHPRAESKPINLMEAERRMRVSRSRWQAEFRNMLVNMLEFTRCLVTIVGNKAL